MLHACAVPDPSSICRVEATSGPSTHGAPIYFYCFHCFKIFDKTREQPLELEKKANFPFSKNKRARTLTAPARPPAARRRSHRQGPAGAGKFNKFNEFNEMSPNMNLMNLMNLSPNNGIFF